MSDSSEVVTASNNAPQLRNIAADKSKSGRKQGGAALRKFNEYFSTDHEHLHLPENINFESLRLTDFRSDDDDSTCIANMLGRYGHFYSLTASLAGKHQINMYLQ